MKKNLFMVAAVALMAMVSCNKEEVNSGIEGQASDIVFVAGFDQDAQTKTALGEAVDGFRQATWVEGDKISINGVEFSAKTSGATSEFTTTGQFDEAGLYRAVYPSTSYVTATVVEIPNGQDGSFANASISVAESANQSLSFTNLSSILKFQVPVECKTVKFESTASIAGRITVNYVDGEMTPDYVTVTQPQKAITLTGNFVPETDYFVAVKPDKHQFTVSIDGNVSKASDKTVTVERSMILNMGVLPEPVVEEEAVIRINNLNGWGDLNITIMNESTTLVNAQPMTKEEGNIFAYRLDNKYVDTEVTYYITHSWYQTSTKTVTLKADSEATPIVLNTTYLEPGTWDWTSATFGAWMWGTGVTDTMVTGVKVKDNFFEFEIPATTGYKNVIFVRCNNNNPVASWDTKWNQTGDLTLQHKCYCVNVWDNGGDSQWF